VLGGLSLGGSPGALEEDFLDDILADADYPAGRYFDVANFHHYGPPGEARRRIEYVRGALDAVGAGGKPIWVTEVGYASDTAQQREPAYQGAEGRAAWLTEMLPFLLELGVEKVFWFTLFDLPPSGGQFASHGLLDAELQPKPAARAFRDLIASAR
jgi:hypothetical protein